MFKFVLVATLCLVAFVHAKPQMPGPPGMPDPSHMAGMGMSMAGMGMKGMGMPHAGVKMNNNMGHRETRSPNGFADGIYRMKHGADEFTSGMMEEGFAFPNAVGTGH